MRFLLALILLVGSTSFVCAQNEELELFSTAQRAFDDGFHDVAIRYLEEFLPKYPQSPKMGQVKLLLGQCYYLKNDYAKSLGLLKSVGDITENKDMLLFWLGETYLKLSNVAEARSSYEQLSKSYPSSAYAPQGLYSLGWSYFDEKNYGKAQDIFSKLVALFPKHQLSEDATLKIAECTYNLGDYTAAVKAFELYSQNYPESTHEAQVSLNIADAYYYTENYIQAILSYEKVLKATDDPEMMEMAYVGRIWCAIKRKMYEQASKWIKEAIEFAKSKHLPFEDLYLASGNLLYEKGDWAGAVSGYTDLINSFPTGIHRLEAYLGRGNAYYFLKKYAESIADLKFVIDHHQSDSDQELVEKANLGLGWSFVKAGELGQAMKCFQYVFEHANASESKINALIQMADAYHDSGKFIDAVGIYENVAKTYPGNSWEDYVQYRTGIALLKAEKIEASILAFDKLQKDFVGSKYLEDINYYNGIAQFKRGDWGAAVGRMEAFIKALNHPSEFTPEANYILALSYLNLKQSEDALKIFQKILRLYPDDAEVAKNSDIGIAKCQFELGQVKEAVKRFKLIVYKYPKTDVEQEALLWLAQYAIKNSQYAEAVDYYSQILERFPEIPDVDQIHYELGQAYEVQGALDQALAQYKAVSPKDPGLYSKVKLAIAGIFSKEFDPQKALSAYQNIVLGNPEYARDAYLKMAQLYRNSQEYSKEIDTYQKALKIDQGKANTSNAELLFNIADAKEAIGRVDESVEYYLRIPAQYPNETAWVVKGYLRVAKIFEDRKDWEGAKVTYQKIIQLKTDESKYALERLDWLKKK